MKIAVVACRDHGYLGRAEFMNMPRPRWFLTKDQPGPDLVFSAAGAFAQCYLALNISMPAFAARCLDHALDLYDWGITDTQALSAGRHYDDIVPGVRLALFGSTVSSRF